MLRKTIVRFKWIEIRIRVLPCGCLQVVCRPDGRFQQLTLRLHVVCKWFAGLTAVVSS